MNDLTPATLPVPTPEAKRPWYKRKAIAIPGAVVVGMLVLSGAINAANGDEEPATTAPLITQESEPAEVQEAVMVTVPDTSGMTVANAYNDLVAAGLEPESITSVADLAAVVTSTTPAAGESVEEGTAVTFTVEEKPKMTTAQESAVRSAQSYLSFKGFSRAGLLNQLTSEYGEDFETADAEFAIAHIEAEGGVDWNAEAVQSAESYLSFKGFSRQGLFDQLTSAYGEEFTAAQANYALDAVGL